MSFILALFFAGGLGVFSIFFGILASSLFSLFDDASGNLMPTIIGLSWLVVPFSYFNEGPDDQMILGIGGLIGFIVGIILGLKWKAT